MWPYSQSLRYVDKLESELCFHIVDIFPELLAHPVSITLRTTLHFVGRKLSSPS